MIRPLVLAAVMLLTPPAYSHDWFTGTTDPVRNVPCCSGYQVGSAQHVDCQTVPAEMAGIIQETAGGYRVTMTLEQAKFFNDHSTKPVDEVVEYKRVQPGLSKGYAICIYDNHVQCFFAPSNM